MYSNTNDQLSFVFVPIMDICEYILRPDLNGRDENGSVRTSPFV